MKMFDIISDNKGASAIKTTLLIFIVIMILGGAAFLTSHFSFLTKKNDSAQSSQKPGERKILFYRNPMNPAITSSVPAKDEMGMDYIPVYSDEGTAPKKTIEQETDDFFAEGPPAGLAPITLSEQGIKIAGVQTAPVVRDPFILTIRTVGRVVPDETGVRRVQTRVSGWVEKLYVNFAGQYVRQGEPILSVYSPELLSSQEEFLQAKETAARMTASSDIETRKFGEVLLNAAKRRLRLFEVPDNFIRELERTKKATSAVTLVAPISGYVIGKAVLEGQKTEPGMELFTISDLSKIWIEADFYEYEANTLKTGMDATVSSSYFPEKLIGKIAYVYPYLNAESRTLKARLEFSNENMVLKPGMFVDVSLMADLGESVVIPDSAVMDSGVRKIVFVNKAKNSFEPREIKTGAKSNGKYQILSGLQPGEMVAVRANFLLDSESRLQAIIQGMMKK
jgi:Cu(I)/Ag(I) efflux system membrane fusion protein